MMAGDTLFN